MPASFTTCHHVLPTSKRCGSPALRGEQFCFYHHPTRRPPTRVPSRIPFDVEAITDPEALQIALSEVIRRLADNTLDLKRASLLLITLQMAKANLPAMPRYPPYPSEEPCTRDSASRTVRSTDFADLSGLLAVAGLQPTHAAPEH